MALEGDAAFLRHLDDALQTPAWQMAAGRKAFPFSCPVRVPNGVVELPASRAIALHPCRHPGKLRIVQEVPQSLDVRRDVPLNFEQRLFKTRCVQTNYIAIS